MDWLGRFLFDYERPGASTDPAATSAGSRCRTWPSSRPAASTTPTRAKVSSWAAEPSARSPSYASSRRPGDAFTVEHVPEDVLSAQLEQADNDVSKSVIGLMLDYARSDAKDMTEVLGAFPSLAVRDYATRVLAG